MLKKLAMGAAALVVLPASAWAEWFEIRTDQFIVYSEADRDEAVEFAQLLEKYDRAMRVTQNIPFAPAKSDAQRVTVFHWGDGNDIAELATGSRRAGVRGFYIPRAGQPVAFSPAEGQSVRQAGSRQHRDRRTQLDRRSVLLHEYAHSFMLQHFPATYPQWYVEGFAEFYSQIDFLEDGSFHLGNPPQYRGDFLRRGPTYHIEQLFDTSSKIDGMDQANWYSTGWLTLHYLTFAQDRRGQLADFLARIQKGERSLDAAKAAFGDLGRLNSDIRSYLKGDLLGYNIKPANFDDPTVNVRELSDAEEAVIEYRMRSWRGVDEKEARSIQSALESRADLSTDSVLVAMTLAEAEFDAKNWDAAERAAKRALEINPSHSKASLYLGRISAKRAEEADEAQAGSGKPWWDKARAFYLDAVAADRNDPLPLYEYYQSFRDADEEPSEQALIALENAYVLAPYDMGVRGTLVRQLAEEGKALLAADLVTPLVFAPHSNEDVEQLRSAMEMIRAGQEKEGVEQMTAFFDRMEAEAEEKEKDS